MSINKDSKLPIDALKKVTLSVKASTKPPSHDLNPEPSSFEIIFGLGVEGLTPFEFLLSKYTEGDTFSMNLDPNDICKTFQHISLPHMDIPKSTETIFFTFEVKKVMEADSREVIKSMAEMSACGGGSCECCGH